MEDTITLVVQEMFSLFLCVELSPCFQIKMKERRIKVDTLQSVAEAFTGVNLQTSVSIHPILMVNMSSTLTFFFLLCTRLRVAQTCF